jgi:hypothetical protein
MCTARLPVGDWTDAPAGLNGVCHRVSNAVYQGFGRTCYLNLPWRFGQKIFSETLVSIYRKTRYQPTVMCIAVTVRKIYHNVLLFAPAIRVDLVKRLQFLTTQAGGNKQAYNTSEGEHFVLNEVQCKCYFLLCRHNSILQLLSHTNKNTWNDQIPARCVACRSQSNKWQSMLLYPFLLHSGVVINL